MVKVAWWHLFPSKTFARTMEWERKTQVRSKLGLCQEGATMGWPRGVHVLCVNNKQDKRRRGQEARLGVPLVPASPLFFCLCFWPLIMTPFSLSTLLQALNDCRYPVLLSISIFLPAHLSTHSINFITLEVPSHQEAWVQSLGSTSYVFKAVHQVCQIR